MNQFSTFSLLLSVRLIFIISLNFFGNRVLANTENSNFNINEIDCSIYGINSTPVTCFGDEDGQICFFITGGNIGVLYNVEIKKGNEIVYDEFGVMGNNAICSFEDLAEGEYNINITSVNDPDCNAVAIATVSSPSEINLDEFTIINASCDGVNNGGIEITVSGGSPNYIYQWSNDSTDMNLTNLAAGDYSVLIIDDNGCTAEFGNFTIVNESNISGIIETFDVSCNGGSDGMVAIIASGGTPPFDNNWSNNESGDTIFGLISGSYEVTVTDSNGCSNVFSGFVNEPQLLEIVETFFHIRCFGENNGEISISASGGNGDYSYAWSNGANVNEIGNLPPGDYIYIVTDAKNCFISDTINIEEPDSLIALAIVINDVSCDEDSDGSTTVQPTGGNGNYSFVWSDGILTFQTQTIENLEVGIYNIIVTDSNECTATDSVEIAKEEKPMITIYDEYANYNEGELTDLYFEANLDGVIFHWEIVDHSNIDSLASDYLDFGQTEDLIEEGFHLIAKRSPGWVLINTYPQKGNCVGDTIQTKVNIYPGEKDCPFIPELVTPNGDGKNDYWDVVFPNPKGGSEYSVQVFNRSGGVVFESSSFTEQWSANGCPDGVYFYIITHQLQQTQCKGAVTILRN